MPKDSLKKLLLKFPHFLDKRAVSNFYKSQYVTNESFKGIYQSLFNVIESFRLDKRLVIWKVQSEPYIYSINFVASYPHLKTVKCYKNDNLIYIETYEDSEKTTNFIYSYNFPQENNSLQEILSEYDAENQDTLTIPNDAKIIPDDKFRIEIETYDELKLEKGFPENDTEEGNIYDHDFSLDEIGALHNIPRRTYIETSDYENTEPKYNNRLSEDDYHYMNRIINYILLVRTVPLPVAEIYKLYGIEAEMLNRERLLIKMFDIEKHPHIKDNGKLYVSSWDAEKWEHKDGFCKRSDNNKVFFFVSADNIQPKMFHPVTFHFSFLDIFAEPITDEEFLVDISLTTTDTNQETVTSIIKTDLKDSSFKYDELSDEIDLYTFTFTGKARDGTVIGIISIDITVKGCNDGDFYVSANGNDNNDGKTKETPFKTITQAISKITSAQDLIIVRGTIELDKLNTISSPCTIMGCANGTIHSSFDHNKFFNVSKDNTINLTNLNLTHNYAESYFKTEDYTNENDTLSNVESVIIHGGTPNLSINTQKDNFYHYYDNVHIIGSFLNRKGNPIKNTDLDLYADDVKLKTITTDDDGLIDEWLHYEENNVSKNQEITYNVKFLGSDVHYETESSKNIIFSKDTTDLGNLRYGKLLRISSQNNESGELLYLYERRNDGVENKKNAVSDTNGEATFTYLPSYGQQLILISEDGLNIREEFLIDVRFYITDLETDSLVIDVKIEGDKGNLYVFKKPLSSFKKLSDLEDVIIDLTIDDDGNFYKEYFTSSHQDLLEGNEIYPDDLEKLSNAITNVYFSNEEGHEGDLYCERINIEMEEEP